jgi:membrane associated rhomboid family serine protease
MIIVPYSTALELSKPPVVTYLAVLICALVFCFQISFGITENLMYFPATWNPIKMITSSLAHGGWLHLIGNMIFYLAFAPALEILLGSRLRYIWIMMFIAFVVGFSYSIATLIGSSPPLPTLGFSGIVMGMIGLSGYLMPTARIRVFWWYGFGWKTLHVQAWILALAYIGLDTWTMLTAKDYGYVNVVAHVSGGFAGYFYGFFWLMDRRDEIQEELAFEIEAMDIKRAHGNTRAEAFRYKQETDRILSRKQELQSHDKFMGRVYRLVKAHRDSEAVTSLLEKYDLDTPTHELEQAFARAGEWGPSRTLLCLGRLILQKLDREKRYGKAIVYIEKCQNISPQFALPDIARVLFYAEMAIDTGKTDVAKNLLADSAKRYGSLVNHQMSNHLLQKTR